MNHFVQKNGNYHIDFMLKSRLLYFIMKLSYIYSRVAKNVNRNKREIRDMRLGIHRPSQNKCNVHYSATLIFIRRMKGV